MVSERGGSVDCEWVWACAAKVCFFSTSTSSVRYRLGVLAYRLLIINYARVLL